MAKIVNKYCSVVIFTAALFFTQNFSTHFAVASQPGHSICEQLLLHNQELTLFRELFLLSSQSYAEENRATLWTRAGHKITSLLNSLKKRERAATLKAEPSEHLAEISRRLSDYGFETQYTHYPLSTSANEPKNALLITQNADNPSPLARFLTLANMSVPNFKAVYPPDFYRNSTALAFWKWDISTMGLSHESVSACALNDSCWHEYTHLLIWRKLDLNQVLLAHGVFTDMETSYSAVLDELIASSVELELLKLTLSNLSNSHAFVDLHTKNLLKHILKFIFIYATNFENNLTTELNSASALTTPVAYFNHRSSLNDAHIAYISLIFSLSNIVTIPVNLAHNPDLPSVAEYNTVKQTAPNTAKHITSTVKLIEHSTKQLSRQLELIVQFKESSKAALKQLKSDRAKAQDALNSINTITALASEFLKP